MRSPSGPATQIEGALKAALVDGLGLKPRKAFAPVRVAVSGRTVSPPLYESMELLGRERSLRPAAGRFGARCEPRLECSAQGTDTGRRVQTWTLGVWCNWQHD